MSNKSKKVIMIDQVLDVYDAFNLVSNNDVLPAETNYWLANLIGKIKGRYKSFMMAREPERLRISKLQAELYKEKKDGYQLQISNLDTEYSLFVETLKDNIRAKEEKSTKDITYDVRRFKRSEFVAAADIKRLRPGGDGKNILLEMKEGDDLVPPQFYLLMGDLIEE